MSIYMSIYIYEYRCKCRQQSNVTSVSRSIYCVINNNCSMYKKYRRYCTTLIQIMSEIDYNYKGKGRGIWHCTYKIVMPLYH